jgi:hypothetical protein
VLVPDVVPGPVGDPPLVLVATVMVGSGWPPLVLVVTGRVPVFVVLPVGEGLVAVVVVSGAVRVVVVLDRVVV